MKRLYEKNEIGFALVWIGLYVVLMNVGLQFCGGLDDLAGKTVPQLLAPVGIGLALAAASTAWICRSGLQEKYGLCAFRGSWKGMLFFIPLVLISLVNAVNGLGLTAPLTASLLMMANMAVAGYVEEILFRGFLFRAMQKDNLRSAVIVSAVTFGVGHIVNLANTADTLGVLLQVCYAVAIGFLFTVIVYKGRSLWPVILCHMLVNGSSVFALEEGPFTSLVQAVTGSAAAAPVVTALGMILIASAGSWWIWKKA